MGEIEVTDQSTEQAALGAPADTVTDDAVAGASIIDAIDDDGSRIDATGDTRSPEPTHTDESPPDHISKNPSVIAALEMIFVLDVPKAWAVDWACRNDESVPADWGDLL